MNLFTPPSPRSPQSFSDRPDRQGARKSEGTSDAYGILERGVYAALETYSNVHRGSGHKSMVTTSLYEQARSIVLEYLGLQHGGYVVIFCTPRRAALLEAQLKPGSFQTLSGKDIDLPLGIVALAVKRKALPRGVPFETGGGTTRLIAPDWVIWDKAPGRFEAGTPAIVNIIAFAKVLRMMRKYGDDIFSKLTGGTLPVAEILYRDEMEAYTGQELLDKLRNTMIGKGIRVPTMKGPKPYINLDNGASTPAFMPVWNTVCRAWRQSRQVQLEIIPEVRSVCSEMLGAPEADYNVIFTSNTTEAINIVAESLRRECSTDTEPVVINTLLEHNSNELTWRLGRECSLIRLPVDDEGFIDMHEMESLLCEYNRDKLHGKKRIRIVAASGASNVLGVFNNLEEISRMVHRHGASLLVDAAQLVAHRKVDMQACGIDYLAFSGHKVYAPFGTGVLVVRKGLLHYSRIEMDLIRSSGEENITGIAALGKALILLQRIGLDRIQNEEQVLTGRILHDLAKIKGLKIYGIKDTGSTAFTRKGGVIVFGLDNLMANRVANMLAERGGIGVRYGCHCAHLLIKHLVNVGPFLERFQGFMLTLLPGLRLPGLTRISLGLGNTGEDIDNLIQTLHEIVVMPSVSETVNRTSIQNRVILLSQKEVQKQMNEFTRAAAKRVYS
jgi:selenocysteine lyase/cysteine desulfurase